MVIHCNGSNYPGVQIAVEYTGIDQLLPPVRKLRSRSPRQLKRLADSISDFGFLVPVLIDEEGRVVTGQGRIDAAKLLGMTSVPVIRIEHLTEAQRRLFAIADNETPQGVDFIPGALSLELKEIQLLEPRIELATSGLSIARIDTLMGRARTDEFAEANDEVVAPEAVAVSRIGDVWRLGRHVLACGDARDAALLTSLADGRRVRMLLTDSPWNLKIEGVVSGLGRHKHRDFQLGVGEMSREEFVTFLREAIAAAEGVLVEGALLYLFMDWRNLDALTEAARAQGMAQKNLLVWCKDNAGMGSLYRSQHELVGVYKHGNAPHTNNVRLGEDGRNRTNCLFYPGANSFGKGRDLALAAHPTSKPVALLADLILDVTAPGELVLDTFGGSGSTLIAAERMDRTCCMVELEPAYVDGIVRRFEALTGTEAVHATDGHTFREIAAERLASQALETADHG